jgi:hypothetical protein
MDRRRLTTIAASCVTAYVTGCAVAWHVGIGPVATANAPLANIHPPSRSVDAGSVDTGLVRARGTTALSRVAVGNAGRTTFARPADTTDVTIAAQPPDPVAEIGWAEPSQPPRADTQPIQLASANPDDPVLFEAKQASGAIEIFDECLVADPCVDRYLWALYQRTPKEDSIKVEERRKVQVRKKGKLRTVTRTFTKVVDEDFTWKDPKAADKAGMAMVDYVIGGMDRTFKLKLFHVLRAAEQAGLSPGITSAFRDDYRQSIASGLKAATDRSYHGGSFRGGYGHGLAADVVSVKGATRAERYVSTEVLWKWIDDHGSEFGIGRPYLDHDPPHLSPTDGKEWADHRGTKKQDTASDGKKPNAMAKL